MALKRGGKKHPEGQDKHREGGKSENEKKLNKALQSTNKELSDLQRELTEKESIKRSVDKKTYKENKDRVDQEFEEQFASIKESVGQQSSIESSRGTSQKSLQRSYAGNKIIEANIAKADKQIDSMPFVDPSASEERKQSYRKGQDLVTSFFKNFMSDEDISNFS